MSHPYLHPVREEQLRLQTRRQFLSSAGQFSLGAIALQALSGDAFAAPAPAENPLAPKRPPLKARAKRVIYLHMSGGPPNLDIFDPKPALVEHNGKPCPDSFLKGRTFAFTSGVPKLMGSPRTYKQYGRGGLWMSDAVPNFQTVADDVTLLRAMHTDQFNHAPAELLLFTGHARQGRPSLGSWATYGLGSENQDLPGFVTLISSGTQPSGGQGCWGSGFLPSVYQGVQCRSKGDPVLFANDPPGMTRDLRRATLDALKDLNQRQQDELGHAETVTRIAQYELAFRMQTSVPDVMDISKESAATLEAYGAKPGEASFANNCLLARRLVEKGVRFVHLFDWGWDFHGTNPREDIRDGLTKKMAMTDKPAAALIKDLKQRGLLDDTLIVWGGEFGRTTYSQGALSETNYGRDHHPRCFTVLMAGAGVNKGTTYGETDDFSYNIVKDGVHVHDLNATILHLMGVEHTRLTYRYQGRDFRLTDIHGEVVKKLLA